MADKYGRKVPANPEKDKAMNRFIDNVNRENLVGFLESSQVERHESLFLMMQDPAYAKVGFSTLARKAGVTLHELQSLYTDGMRQLALLRMSNVLPELMADVAEDAKSRMETCSRCDGKGLLVSPEGETRDCPTCKAKGEVRRIGDKQARELMFESAKLIKQSGPLVAIQNNISTGDSRMENMLKRTRAIVLDQKEERKEIGTE